MTDSGIFEKMDLFYLGRELDPESGESTGMPMLYKNKHLTTHAAIIGMTGSGKTGLGICLLEEAALDSIPAIVVDPKGDMANLLLTFPDMKPADFLPWIDSGKASQLEVSPEEMARQTAAKWKKGIESWGQDGERIARLRKNADLAVYTPGSTAGRQLSVLDNLDAPESSVLEDSDILSGLINSTISSMLGLIGIHADPLKSREHILLSSILLHHWRRNTSLNLEALIGNVVKPPMERIGVFPMESFYPMSDRMNLAMQLNNIIASPSFSGWTTGEPLQIGNMLFHKSGKPRISIFSIAHLSEPERMFFVTMLLGRLINWMRQQEGSSGLRCVLYMDEIFGYFPPTANPPSKKPMLLLLKQARAYGLGVVLATQNPVDLDYKGLANIGTWFIGRLQTRQDQDKVISGMSDGSEKTRDDKIRQLLSNLKSRCFIMKSAHFDELIPFETRWCLSYLKGPVSLNEIEKLTSADSDEKINKDKSPSDDYTSDFKQRDVSDRPPIFPGTVEQRFILPPVPIDELRYKPWLAGAASVRFYDKSRNIDQVKNIQLHLPVDQNEVDWNRAIENPYRAEDCFSASPQKAQYSIPPELLNFSKIGMYSRQLSDFLYRGQGMKLYRVASLKLESMPAETMSQFQKRLADLLKDKKEEEGDKIEQNFRNKGELLKRQLERALDKIEKEKSDVTAKGVDTALSFGIAVFGAIFGRKGLSVTNASRSAQGVRSAGKLMKEKHDVQRAEEDAQQVQSDIAALALEYQDTMKELSARYSPENFPVEEFFIKPRRADIFDVKVFLQWEPVLDFAQLT